eukprot:6214674-Pleurochrysis_carterae.AAC.3
MQAPISINNADGDALGRLSVVLDANKCQVSYQNCVPATRPRMPLAVLLIPTHHPTHHSDSPPQSKVMHLLYDGGW